MDVIWAWVSTLEQWDELIADRCLYENTTMKTTACLQSPLARLKATTMANRTGLPRLYVDSVVVDKSATLNIHLRESDVLVGLLPPFNTGDVTLRMGNTPLSKYRCHHHTIDLSTGQPELIMENNCVPLIALSSAQVLIETLPGTVLHVVHAVWPDQPRRLLGWGGWAIGRCIFLHGMISFCLSCGAEPQLPRWHHWRERAAFHSTHHERYLRELMVKACHPRRIEQIVAEEDRLEQTAL